MAGGDRAAHRGRRDGPRAAGQAPRLEPPAGITAADLDAGARAELRTLPADLADAVARWLAAAGREEDPDLAYAYARRARELAARVGVVRETSGIAAYRAGRWADALAELRTARRLTGDPSYLPMMADSERALGRLDRALALIDDQAARNADRATGIELAIVASGIRRDQGLPEAAVAVLQVPELTDGRPRPWSARLFYAYADALLDAGREEEARVWFGHAAAADAAGETDAAERYSELDSVLIEDLAETGDAGPDPAQPREDGAGGTNADPDAAGPNRAGTDSAGTDGARADGAGTDGAGTDGAGADGAGPNRAGTDGAGADGAGGGQQ